MALENVAICILFGTEDHSFIGLHELRENIYIYILIENEEKGNKQKMTRIYKNVMTYSMYHPFFHQYKFLTGSLPLN